jgi:hypothetical protein
MAVAVRLLARCLAVGAVMAAATSAIGGLPVQDAEHASQRGWVPVAYEDQPGEDPLDETSAMAWARWLNQPVEATALASSTTRIVADPSGVFRAELSPKPVRVQQEGQWVDVDPSLVEDGQGGFAPRAAVTQISVSGGGSGDLVSMSDAGRRLALSWPQSLPEPDVEGALATYADVLPGVDLVVEAGVEGFATYLVVESRQAAANPALGDLRFALAASGEVTQGPDGSLEIADSAGAPVFTAPQPRMWDSSEQAGVPDTAAERVAEAMGARATRLTVEATSTEIRLLPDQAFLTDPATTYPVVIDPSWSKTDQEHAWAMVWSNGMEFYNSSTEQARVGYDGWSSATKKSRSLYKFDTSFFRGRRIESAIFRHHQVHSPSYSCDTTLGPGVELWRTEGFGPNVSWPGPALAGNKLGTEQEAHGHRAYCSGFTLNEWNATPAVKWAVNNDKTRLSLQMRSANEGDAMGWRQFKGTSSAQPQLEVLYNTVPNTPAAPTLQDEPYYSDVNKTYTDDLTPTFQVKLTDPDGDQLKAQFKVHQGSTLKWDYTTVWKNSGQTIDRTLPAGVITEDGTYWVEVRAWDGDAWSGWSTRTTFVVDRDPPAVPTVQLPAQDPSYDRGGRFTFTSNSSDVYQYKYGFTTSAPNKTVKAKTEGGSATIVYIPATFGPDWVTVQALDRAGNASAASPDVDFRVKGTKANHQWPLDGADGGVGPDTVGGTALVHPAGAVWAPEGRYHSYDLLPQGEDAWATSDRSLLLDGDDEATTAGPAIEDTSRSFTVSAWVKLDASAQDSNRTAVAQLGSTMSAFYLGWNKDGWAFWVRELDDSGTTVVAKSSPHTLPAQAEWTHLVGVYSAARELKKDDRVIRLYVNGQLATPAVGAPEGVFDADGSLVVGRSQFNGNPNNHWAGQIDDVRTFPGPLDPLGVLALSTEIRDQEVTP